MHLEEVNNLAKEIYIQNAAKDGQPIRDIEPVARHWDDIVESVWMAIRRLDLLKDK